jgi:hypothetical protein
VSFGVYLGHMLPLQLLLLTPLAALTGLEALPAPLKAVAVLAIILGVTFAMVLAFQRTGLSMVLTGRHRRPSPAREEGRRVASPAA